MSLNESMTRRKLLEYGVNFVRNFTIGTAIVVVYNLFFGKNTLAKETTTSAKENIETLLKQMEKEKIISGFYIPNQINGNETNINLKQLTSTDSCYKDKEAWEKAIAEFFMQNDLKVQQTKAKNCEEVRRWYAWTRCGNVTCCKLFIACSNGTIVTQTVENGFCS